MQTTIAINLFDMVNRLLCRYPVRRQQRLLIISLISAVLFELTASLKITNIIPNYCDRSVESKNQYQTILLNQTGSETASLQLGANILKGIEILPNYQCNLIVQSPPNTGLVLTFRKTALNNKDSLTVRTGSNPGGAHVWNNRHHEQRPDNEHGQEFQEVATLVNQNYPSSLIIKYQPALGIAHFNSGFDLAITLFTEKRHDCGNYFDCGNSRCIESSLQCDGYNNCGNETDETSCPGHISWWLIALLIPIALIVVVLAIFVWIRMSRG